MTKNRDNRTRWEKVRDNIYAEIVTADKMIDSSAAMMLADMRTDILFAQIGKQAPMQCDESEPTADEWSFTEQRAGEARMETDDE